MARTDELITTAWRDAGWRTGRQRLRLEDVRGVVDYPTADAGPFGLRTYPLLEGTNLVAIAEGTSRPGDAIVVIAHHDTVRDSPGADDNGAAVAVLLELAARLSGRRFAHTVILATPDFEEIGMIGSAPLVRWLGRRYRVRGAIVFDPIGFMDPRPGTQAVPMGIDRLYPGQVARLAARGNPGDTVVAIYRRRSVGVVREWARCLAAAIGSERVLLLRDPLDVPLLGGLLVALPTARHFSRSDHVRFWRAGMPAIQVTDTANFRNPNYHRPTDTPDTLDYETLAGIAAATALSVERLAG